MALTLSLCSQLLTFISLNHCMNSKHGDNYIALHILKQLRLMEHNEGMSCASIALDIS